MEYHTRALSHSCLVPCHKRLRGGKKKQLQTGLQHRPIEMTTDRPTNVSTKAPVFH